MPADDRKDVSSKHEGLVFCKVRPLGRNEKMGCNMALTAFRFPFGQNVDERRFSRLTRLLEVIQVDIEKEVAALRPCMERVTDCAAFALEAMENGESPECMSAKIDTLEQNLAIIRGRQALLEQETSFVDAARAALPRVLSPHGS
ncbi:hypothetical protein LB559_30200 [Mesorhizobium sp. BR1-1-3]|uniref:hypothetical protein n=1 Tax=Mesorhizobium sp. BR1-1-3 TaxID=2876651 RepID=UPI001CD0C658|nr:hypothetical protein [Mesorhizobium sp. BR1-1-3]MBZ9892209.1 hypothetical protein [Mesorhizobium sp. BR1-1-3]